MRSALVDAAVKATITNTPRSIFARIKLQCTPQYPLGTDLRVTYNISSRVGSGVV